MGTVEGAVHDVSVGPLEIEGVDERLAHALVLELVAARVDEPALRARGRLVGNDVALDAAVLERGEIVARRPDARGVLLAEEIILRGEAFVGDVAVAVIFEANIVEIVLADADRQLLAPPVLHALVIDEAPRLEPADLVGPRTEWGLERGLVKRLLVVIGAREDR